MKKSLLAIVILCVQSLHAQEYLWPTDASRFLTSSFCESRSGRFHAGIDIKTWNQTGYRIFATRSGYIERFAISPYGYGRVLYLRLDTGETAVYAHLERFNEELQALAEEEQERQKAYRINRHLAPGAFKVEKGQVLGFTGQSGIGVPHLHFELRDRLGRPINALQKDFEVVDNVPPTIAAVVVSPLDPGSKVNGDYVPLLSRPVMQHNTLMIAEPIKVFGKIGFAVSGNDATNGVDNRLDIYRYKLYIDGSLQFQSQFNRFSYNQNDQINLAQEYWLNRRGWGRLHRLYRVRSNALDIYTDLNSSGGAIVVAAAPNEAQPDAAVDAGRALSWGSHQFRIEVEDYFGNATIVEGQLIAGDDFDLQATLQSVDANRIICKQVAASDQRELEAVDVRIASRLNNQNPLWRSVAAVFSKLDSKASLLAQAEGNGQSLGASNVTAEVEPTPALVVHHQSARLLRLVSEDRYGLESRPLFLLIDSTLAMNEILALQVRKDFQPQVLRLEVTTSQPLSSAPRVSLNANAQAITAQMYLREFNSYVSSIPLSQIAADSVYLEVAATNLPGEEVIWRESFSNVAIVPGKKGMLRSADQKMAVYFDPTSTYEPIYGRVLIDTSSIIDPAIIGPVYLTEPKDALLDRRATVEISFPDSILQPEKLGIASRTGETWSFMESEVKLQTRTISARTGSLDDFALMRDEEPPTVNVRSPRAGELAGSRRPEVNVQVFDKLSGFNSEKSIELHLDGKFVISEYDPEREVVLYRPKHALVPGSHVLTVTAKDRCGNETKQEVEFTVQ